jgi:methylenetetrahydrofolate dehydrogenase (NADP+) / methenyltetrahydrofolate cyclohydrolase
MKLLNGKLLAEFIQERQAKQVRALRQSAGIDPVLVIIQTVNDPVINTYIRLKKAYGSEIGVDVQSYFVDQSGVMDEIAKHNNDPQVHGIIVQLPLADPLQTSQVVNAVSPKKDVDALGDSATLDPATPQAIMWLLAGYNINLADKNVVIVGQGTLVGAPLARMLRASGQPVQVVTKATHDGDDIINHGDIVISATGQPGVLHSSIIKHGAVVIDAGVASESGKMVGDAAQDLYDRNDLIITPQKGGVGPLTVCALFENVIRACENLA